MKLLEYNLKLNPIKDFKTVDHKSQCKEQDG